MSDPISRHTKDHVPAPVARIADLMSMFRPPWSLCGGWAVEAWLGRQTRDHDDIDICTFIQDQQALLDHLAGWQLVRTTRTLTGARRSNGTGGVSVYPATSTRESTLAKDYQTVSTPLRSRASAWTSS